VGSRPSL